jgi:hypothetical protein
MVTPKKTHGSLKPEGPRSAARFVRPVEGDFTYVTVLEEIGDMVRVRGDSNQITLVHINALEFVAPPPPETPRPENAVLKTLLTTGGPFGIAPVNPFCFNAAVLQNEKAKLKRYPDAKSAPALPFCSQIDDVLNSAVELKTPEKILEVRTLPNVVQIANAPIEPFRLNDVLNSAVELKTPAKILEDRTPPIVVQIANAPVEPFRLDADLLQNEKAKLKKIGAAKGAKSAPAPALTFSSQIDAVLNRAAELKTPAKTIGGRRAVIAPDSSSSIEDGDGKWADE